MSNSYICKSCNISFNSFFDVVEMQKFENGKLYRSYICHSCNTKKAQSEPLQSVDLNDEDLHLLDEAFDLAAECDWFDTAFLSNVKDQYLEKGFITDRQRDVVKNIIEMLERKLMESEF